MRDTPIIEVHDVTTDRFASDILEGGQPVILRGVANDWPAVQTREPPDFARWLLSHANPSARVKLIKRPVERARFFYHEDDMHRFNFQRGEGDLRTVLDVLVRGTPGETLYMGSTLLSEFGGDLIDQFPLPLVPSGTEGRLWLGGQTVISTHQDASSNIACVVAGRRHFTLFPPQQLRNLYPGPIEHTPAGPQVSLPDVDNPDFERFPRFREALKTAQTATLEPGDAIFIPPLWWHHVRALEPFNALVNFWWHHRPQASREPMEAFVLSLLSLRQLPDAEREAWRDMFDYYVFRTQGEPMAHLPFADQGVLGDMTLERAVEIRRFFDGLMAERP